jgi:hypothetical protein
MQPAAVALSLEEVVHQEVEVNLGIAVAELHRCNRAYYPILHSLKKSLEGVTFPVSAMLSGQETRRKRATTLFSATGGVLI